MRAIDADKAIEVAQIKYNDWNLAMAAADGRREINLCFKKQELFKAVKAVLDCVPTLAPPNEPLTQAGLDKMHFDRVWIDYGVSDDGEREGENGIILYGKLYSIDTLDGAGFEDLLLDAIGHGGDTLDNPSGNYTVYRRPPEGEA